MPENAKGEHENIYKVREEVTAPRRHIYSVVSRGGNLSGCDLPSFTYEVLVRYSIGSQTK